MSMVIKLLKKYKLLVVIVLGAAGYYAWNNPAAVPYPPFSAKISQVKEQGVNTEEIKQFQMSTPGLVMGIKDQIITMSKNTKVPTEVSGLPEEVVVEDIVNQMTAEVKKLPQKQAEKIKIQFCQDVLREATRSGIND